MIMAVRRPLQRHAGGFLLGAVVHQSRSGVEPPPSGVLTGMSVAAPKNPLSTPAAAKWGLITLALLFLGLVLVLPLAAVFVEAFRKGLDRKSTRLNSSH